MKAIILILNILSILVNKSKKILKAVMIVSPIIIAAFYIILCFINLTPPNPLTKKYKHHVSRLLVDIPLPQGWNLFAPSPVYTSIKLLMRCKDGFNWSSWFDPLENIIKKSHNLRFSTNEILMQQYKYIGDRMRRYIAQEKKERCKSPNAKECKDLKKVIDSSEEKKMILRFTENKCTSKVKNLAEFEYKLIEIHPKSYSKKDGLEDFSKIDVILQGNHKKTGI